MDKIIVLDFGGQYCHLIANRIRRLKVYSEIMPSDTVVEKLKDAKGIILSGGPSSVYEEGAPKYDKNFFTLDVPILGLCYGHHLMAHDMKGEVKPGTVKEYGIADINLKDKSSIFKGLSDSETVWMSHGDTVASVPSGFKVLASTPDCPVAAMGNTAINYYSFQFHPEVTHTPNGMKMLENFVKICGCRQDWNMPNFIDEKIKEIRAFVKKKNVFLLVSGGVDSTVCFSLLTKALGDERVYGLHIDNGFVRKNESRDVKIAIEKLGFKNFHVVDASADFLEAVKGKYNPEEKRKAIGDTFIKVQQEELKKLGLDSKHWILGQGTIYPDTIETAGTENAALIKTHHNRVKLVQDMINQGRVIEPISSLYKDEVRDVGLELGLSKELVFRHPFPGPGLAVRTLCVEKKEKIENEDYVNNKLNKIASACGYKAKVLSIKGVGVQGDFRTYKHPAVVYGTEADWKELEKISTEITNKVKEVNRVVYLIYPEEPSFDILEDKYLTKDRLDILREADYAVNHSINDKLKQELWQFPIILVPLTVKGGESIILRPVYSKEAMTAKFGILPDDVINNIAAELKKQGIDAVFYDITHKPPGTIEWE